MTRLLFVIAVASGCSSSPAPSPACSGYEVPAGTDLSQPTVSFQKDVIPILQNNCALSACHGSGIGTNNGVYLGAPAGPVDTSRVHGALVNVATTTAPTLSYVVPGDPTSSFLQRKVDGDLCPLAAECPGGCGVVMPKDATQLDVASRDTLRRWIKQGAANN